MDAARLEAERQWVRWHAMVGLVGDYDKELAEFAKDEVRRLERIYGEDIADPHGSLRMKGYFAWMENRRGETDG